MSVIVQSLEEDLKDPHHFLILLNSLKSLYTNEELPKKVSQVVKNSKN